MYVIKHFTFGALFIFFLQGCGSDSSGGSVTFSDAAKAYGSGAVISGTASQGSPITGSVTLKDSKNATRTGLIDSATGAYSIAVNGMTAPFILKAGNYYSAAGSATTTNINPLTDLCINTAASAGAESVGNIFTDPTQHLSKVITNLSVIASNLTTSLDTLYPSSIPTTQRDFLSGTLVIDQGVDLVIKNISITTTTDGSATISYNQQLLVSVAVTDNKLAITPHPTTLATLTSAIQTSILNTFSSTNHGVFTVSQVQQLSTSQIIPLSLPLPLSLTQTFVNITPDSPNVPIGETRQFEAMLTAIPTISPVNLTALVTWSSTNTAVATISARGLASAVGFGTATISATFSDGTVRTTTINTIPPMSFDTTITPLSIAALQGLL